MVTRDGCPQCGSQQYKKNGHIHNGKQNHQCKVCERQFVGQTDQHRISDEQRALVERLLLERISLRGICRAVGVGLKWLRRLVLVSFFLLFLSHAGNEPRFGNLDLKNYIEAFAILVLPHHANFSPEAWLTGTVLGTDIADMVNLVGWMGFGLGVFHKYIC